MPPERVRGPYKRYIRELNAPIPRTSAYNRRVQAAAFQNNEQHNNDADHVPSPNNSNVSSEHAADSASESSSDDDEMGAQDRQNNSDRAESSSDSSESELEGEEMDRDADDDNDGEGGNGAHEIEERNGNRENDEGNDDNIGADPDEKDEEEHAVLVAEGGENNEDIRGPALYQGCPLTLMESDLLIMSFVIRWGLEDKSIEELLQLIDCHLPCSVMRSQYLFLNRFPVPDLTKIWYTCSECFYLLPRDFQEGQCRNCESVLEKNKLKDEGNFFIELSLTEQLKALVENESTYRLLRKESQEGDVISGRFYRSLRHLGVCGDNDLTLQWNTDGVSPFKTSKMQAWPIQVCVNELPFHARRENMILCGLYFGKGKPHFNSFLKPFVDELQSLHRVGFQCKFPGQEVDSTVKVHTILASVDSVARPLLQGIKQFNGSYGCSFCLHRGMNIDRGNGSARVYAGNVGAPRDLVQHLTALEELEEYNRVHRRKKKHVQGVKTTSILLRLRVFNIITGFVPDYMHSILEGVVKQFITHWSDGTYKDSPWYLGKAKRKLISEKLQVIKPPVEVTRAPRGLDELKLMTASELRHFLLYYSIPCLHGILPARYLQHWFLLVFGMTIYLRENFSREEAALAKYSLQKFFEETSTIYPDCMHLHTFNMHLLLHIPHAVSEYGGLWGSSTFPYKHFNEVLSRLITGTRHVPEHICSSYIRLRQTFHLGSRVFAHPDCSVKGKKLFQSLTSKYRTSQFSRHWEANLRLFGSGDIHNLSLIERVSAQQLLNHEILTIAHSFRRMIFRGTVYHASSYEALRVRNSSVIKLDSGRVMDITHIVTVMRRNYVQSCIVIGVELDVLHEILCHDRELNVNSRDLIHVCRRTNRTMCALPTNISRKCVAIPCGNAVYVCPLVNMLERD